MTNTDKWKDKWFRALNPMEKILFIYLTENCNNAGFIEVDYEYWAFQIGADIDEIETAFKELKNSIETVGEWCWIVNFLKHQRNLPLNPNNNAHKNIINIINEFKNKFISSIKFKEFLGANEGLISPPVMYSNSNSINLSNSNSILDKKNEILNSKLWIENICMKKRLKYDVCVIYLGVFLDDLELKNDLEKPINDIRNHFINWLDIEIEKEKKNNKPPKYHI